MKNTINGKGSQAGLPQDVQFKKYDERIMPDFRGYNGTYDGVMEQMREDTNELRKNYVRNRKF